LKACGLVTGAAGKRNPFVCGIWHAPAGHAENVFNQAVNRPGEASPCRSGGFRLLPLATSRVELTLNANLLPSKVASPQRGDAADPATKRNFAALCVCFALGGGDEAKGGVK
jgi:hypothetical protein